MMSSSGPVRHVVAWLAPVRWSMCALLWVVLAIVWVLPHLDLPLRGVAPFGLTAAICRTLIALLLYRGHAVPRALVAVSLAADALLLTGLLDITGGPFNPFIVMYVTYVWLAFVTTGPRWGVLVTAASLAGFGWLLLDHVQAEMAEHHRLNDFPTHLFTMWFSGAAIAELVAHYVSRARAALASRQQQLDDARERALRSEHLASLTTLAAGAAHELSTPLATIAVAARELERQADRLAVTLPPVEGLKADATLIRTEVDRCQVILDGMSGRAPGSATAAAEPLTAAALAQRVRDRLADDEQRRLRVDIASDLLAPAAVSPGMVQAVSSLLRNAFQASDPQAEVVLRLEQRGSMVHVEVCDRGSGMLPEIARRAGEPFYTTKEPGRGMGLGLFLTRTFVERAGGTLRFDTADGTTAVLEIPAEREGMVRS
jgi:two-component system sensor histidine kinase RegB